ncbi:MAG: YihY/virulence factor BrkB family protein [Agromyces sp.]
MRHRPELPVRHVPEPIRRWDQFRYVLGRTLHECARDQLPDVAAGLTYYAIFAVFPALLAVFSILGLIGRSTEAAHALLELAARIGGSGAAEALRDPLHQLTASHGTGWALAIGIGGAVWGASGYVAAFGRALNRVYGVVEGRGVLRLACVRIGATVLVVFISCGAGLALSLSQELTSALQHTLHWKSTAVTLWEWGRYPLLVLLAIALVSVLYGTAGNVKREWFSWGGVTALAAWAVLTSGLSWYVSAMNPFAHTYGALGSLIAIVLWLWLSNLLLVCGAELDSELLRLRQLQLGKHVEARLDSALKATRAIEKLELASAADIRDARRIRRATFFE